MTVVQGMLLAVLIAIFVYQGVAVFKPAWFENLDGFARVLGAQNRSSALWLWPAVRRGPLACAVSGG
jgi:hypothetical protein